MTRICALLVATIAMQVTMTDAFGESPEDVSVLIFRGAGGEMAWRPIALTMAEMIFRRVYGEEGLERQLPLHVRDGGDRWIIEGSARPEVDKIKPGEPVLDKAEIEILKANCQVVKLSQAAHFVAPAQPSR